MNHTDCVEGHVYRVDARNFSVAVCAGVGVFIGIRTKFGNRYLDVEYGDSGPFFNTVRVIEDMGIVVPQEISLKCFGDSVCEACGKRVAWSGPPSPAPWVHVDAPDCGVGDKLVPVAKHNDALFAFLEGIE